MKEIADESFKQTLDDGTDGRSDDTQKMPEVNPEHGCCIDKTILEYNLCVRIALRRRRIEQDRPMPLRIIVHWNRTKVSVD